MRSVYRAMRMGRACPLADTPVNARSTCERASPRLARSSGAGERVRSESSLPSAAPRGSNASRLHRREPGQEGPHRAFRRAQLEASSWPTAAGWTRPSRSSRRRSSLDPSSAHAHDNLATVYSEKKLFREALAEYLTAIRLEPDSATAHYNLACFLATHGHDMAVAEYRDAIELDAEYPDAHLNLGLTLADQGKSEEAVKEPRDRHPARPEGPVPRHELAALLMDEGDYRTTITQLKEVCAARAGQLRGAPRSRSYAQKAFLRRGRAPTRARAPARGPPPQLQRLRAVRALGQPRDALEALRKAVASDPPKVRGWLQSDPMFDALKGTPEFDELAHGRETQLGWPEPVPEPARATTGLGPAGAIRPLAP